MFEIRDIKPKQIRLDSKNPRLERIEDQELEALHGLWTDTNRMLGLARHISEKGLDPTVRLAVIKTDGGGPRDYVVLEGNRRLAALQALEDPGKVSDVLTATQKAKLDGYSTEYRKAPAEKVPCAVFASREDAEPWIELRHSADPTGAGVIMWGAQEKSRFKTRGRTHELAVQIIDLVKKEGKLTAAEAKAVQSARYLTNLRRFTNDPEVRNRLNISSDSDGTLKLPSTREKTVKALSRIVADFATGDATVKDVYHKADRLDYLERLDAGGALPPAPSRPKTGGRASPPKPGAKAGVKGIPRDREKLFRSTITVNFGREARIAKIFAELRSLKLDTYPNAVAVLFRVLLELSVDHYLVQEGVMTTTVLNSTRQLRPKIQAALDDMKTKGVLDDRQLKPLRSAMQKSKGIVGPAHLESIQAYVHNPYFHPRPDDLKIAADDWQTFLETIWS